MKGIVFNIQRFSIHDGPGIRTTVFLKGCSFRCFWCHNPEGIRPKPDIHFFPDLCIGCDECVAVCPQGAIAILHGGRVFQREKCLVCGKCINTCYAGARVLTGKWMSVEEVMEEVLRDRAFYETSGGGVTLSGGEPVLQRDFAFAILQRCKVEGVHTAIETAADCRWEDLELLLSVTDIIMMDIKHMNPDKHRLVTGVSNNRILANARRLVETDKPLIFRIPVIPTVNDTPEEISAIATFIRSLVAVKSRDSNDADTISLELLPFHCMGRDKYRSLDLDYGASQLQPLSKKQMEELMDAAMACGTVVRNR